MGKKEEEMQRTIFVRGIPFDFTGAQLETLFEDIGPIKEGFVIDNKEGEGNRGFGFVQFATQDDAMTAISQLNNTDCSGRRLKIELACKKDNPDEKNTGKKAKKAKTTAGDDDDDDDSSAKAAPAPKKKKTITAAVQTGSGSVSDIIVISGLSNSTKASRLRKVVAGAGTMLELIFPAPESTPKFMAARVLYSSAADAKSAFDKLLECALPGANVQVKLVNNKAARLIIRNLSFKAKEEDLRTFFGDYKPTQVQLPRKPDGKAKGFAFVQFKSLANAMKALADLNGQQVAGRMVAVDWALNKTDYENRKLRAQADAERDNPMEDDDDDDDDDEDDASKNDDEEDDEGDEGDDMVDGEAVDDAPVKNENDVEEGKTVFIRNLLFETTEQDIFTRMKTFGKIHYTKCVMDRNAPGSGRHNGTAFVKFHQQKFADRALKTADGQGIKLGGRMLNVTLAIARASAEKLKVKEVKETDKRNMYLLREGLILPDTEAAEGLSAADLNMRQKAFAAKKLKLKNPNFVISKTRLSIRNLPLAWGDAELKGAVLKAVKAAMTAQQPNDRSLMNCSIKQVKVARDEDRPDANGVGRSKRYGFCEFGRHEWALAALRSLNNNPEVFTKNSRPIIEFAVDDNRKLHARKKRLERSTKSQGEREKRRELQRQEEAHKQANQPQEEEQEEGEQEEGEDGKKKKRKRKTKKKKKDDAEEEEHEAEPEAETRAKKQKRSAEEVEEEAEAAEPRQKKGKKGKKEKKEDKVKKSIPKLSKEEQREEKEEHKFSRLVEDYKRRFFDKDEAEEPAAEAKPAKKRWFEEE